METFTGVLLNVYSRWGGGVLFTLFCVLKRCIISICSLFLSLRCYLSDNQAAMAAVFPFVACPIKLSQLFPDLGDCISFWRLVRTIAACFFICLIPVFLLHKALLLKTAVHISVVFSSSCESCFILVLNAQFLHGISLKVT